jgi:hypothetical protein
MSARQPFNPELPITDTRQAKAALNRIKKRSAALPLQAVLKRQAKLAAFEWKLIERPVLSQERESPCKAAVEFLAGLREMRGLSLAEWALSAMGRRGLTLVPGGEGCGAVLMVLDEEAAVLLVQALSKAKDPCAVINASTAALLAKFGRAP